MVALGRSVRLTCWANAWLAGRTSLDEADDAIRANDTAHHLVGLPGESEAVPLVLGLGGLRRLGARFCSLALPAPGDPLGLAGPRELTEAALEVGEAVVVEGASVGLVPYVIGSGVQWQVYAATPPAPVGLNDASTELTRTLHAAIDVLAELPNAEWTPEFADALVDLQRSRNSSHGALAPGYQPRAEQLATRAATCLLVCDLGLDDQGAGLAGPSVDVTETGRGALRALEAAARRAVVAACAPPRNR